MRRVLLFSVGLHALALVSVVLLRLPGPPAPDEPVRIKVVFGRSGVLPPMPSAPAATRTPVPPRPPAPAVGEPLDVAASAVAAPATPKRAAMADPGLLVQHPSPRMIPAKEAQGNRSPVFPEQALLRHLQGTVLLRLYIGTDGAVTSIETLRSSGSTVLDAAATAALAQWHFLPAMRNGEPVASSWDQPVEFVPNGEARSAW